MDFSSLLSHKHFLVTGGAGFIGSHLVDRLIKEGAQVTVVDNFITGNRDNLAEAIQSGQMTLVEGDVSQPVNTYLPNDLVVDGIFHLASPASPKGYGNHPVETYQVNGFGTHYLAAFACEKQIPLLYTSTSESYGDPLEHPQKETYWGNVNPIGIRACYDESKRFGEMVMTTWAREKQLDAHIVRIFNTYGPRMDLGDGRVVPEILTQALRNQSLTVYGTGNQTRSFCYVSDLVEFILRDFVTPEARGQVINIGNPDEHTILEFTETIKAMTECSSEIIYKPLPSDDPTRRKPDITKAKALLEYEPQVSLDNGLALTINWFKTQVV